MLGPAHAASPSLQRPLCDSAHSPHETTSLPVGRDDWGKVQPLAWPGCPASTRPHGTARPGPCTPGQGLRGSKARPDAKDEPTVKQAQTQVRTRVSPNPPPLVKGRPTSASPRGNLRAAVRCTPPAHTPRSEGHARAGQKRWERAFQERTNTPRPCADPDRRAPPARHGRGPRVCACGPRSATSDRVRLGQLFSSWHLSSNPPNFARKRQSSSSAWPGLSSSVLLRGEPEGARQAGGERVRFRPPAPRVSRGPERASPVTTRDTLLGRKREGRPPWAAPCGTRAAGLGPEVPSVRHPTL